MNKTKILTSEEIYKRYSYCNEKDLCFISLRKLDLNDKIIITPQTLENDLPGNFAGIAIHKKYLLTNKN